VLGRDVWSFILSLALVAIAVAVFEEVLFRGFFFSWLLNRAPHRMAVVLSSIMFALLHSFDGNIVVQFLFYMMMGMALSLIVLGLRSICAAISVHFLWNSAAYFLVGIPEFALAGLNGIPGMYLTGVGGAVADTSFMIVGAVLLLVAFATLPRTQRLIADLPPSNSV
jgi:membrane protease YdiL (CAAX protease family)